MYLDFQYVDFYDVPRTIILSIRGKWILLQSAFDEAQDDYAAEYFVYRLAPSFQPLQAGQSGSSSNKY